MPTKTRILAISGSLRKASSNLVVLQSLAALAPASVEIEFFGGLGELPQFNPDLEGSEPGVVLEYRALLAAVDGVVISSPEYAHGVPGSLKNALDWVVGSGELVDKPIGLINASAISLFAHPQLTEILTVMNSKVVAGANVTIPLRARRMTQEQLVGDPEVAGILKGALDALLEAI